MRNFTDFSSASFYEQGIIASPHTEITDSWGTRVEEDLFYLKYWLDQTHFPIYNGAYRQHSLRGFADGTTYLRMAFYLPETVYDWKDGFLLIRTGIHKPSGAPDRKIISWLKLNGTDFGSVYVYDPLPGNPISYPFFKIPIGEVLFGLNTIEPCGSKRSSDTDATSELLRMSINFFGG